MFYPTGAGEVLLTVASALAKALATVVATAVDTAVLDAAAFPPVAPFASHLCRCAWPR